MPSRIRFLLLHVALASIVLALTPSSAWCAWPHDPFTNVQVAPQGIDQYEPNLVPDLAGGAFVVWEQATDLRVQHLTSTGDVAPGWPTTGHVVCDVLGTSYSAAVAPDGTGGILVAWLDDRNGGQFDPYVMRLTSTGAAAPGWPEDGRRLDTSVNDLIKVHVASDLLGGAYVAWEHSFSATDHDLYISHVSSNSTILWTRLHQPASSQSSFSLVTDNGGATVFFSEDPQPPGGNDRDIQGIRWTTGGALAWGPIVVCDQPNDQFLPRAISDGAGGWFVTWLDERAYPRQVFVQRITPAGTHALPWLEDGKPATSSPAFVYDQSIAVTPDGTGGMFIFWSDLRNPFPASFDLYAIHLTSGGQYFPGWPPSGIPVETGPENPIFPQAVPDGLGGAIVGWTGSTGLGDDRMYAMRLMGNGAGTSAWSPGGTLVCAAGQQRIVGSVISDTRGGVILAWQDDRSAPAQIYAQQVDRFGVLGDASPSITDVRDVAADQGGRVRLDWTPSLLDAPPNYAIGAYWIWRQVPVAQAQAAIARGARWLDAQLETELADGKQTTVSMAAGGLYRLDANAAATYSWEFLAIVAASGFPSYSYTAATTTDSMSGSNPRTAFLVQARHVFGPAFWDSAPDSGYSVDNLAPATPAPFGGAYQSGSTTLTWGPNSEPDFVHYRLHRGGSAGFVPNATNLITQQSQTGFVDNAGTPSFYKLTAVDVHGNASPYALLPPSGTVDVPSTPRPTLLALSSPMPNPVHGAAAVRIALPDAGPVSLDIFDAGGRLIRELVRRPMEAGEHVLRWDGRDTQGRTATSGLYFVQLRAGPRTLRSRMVVLR